MGARKTAVSSRLGSIAGAALLEATVGEDLVAITAAPPHLLPVYPRSLSVPRSAAIDDEPCRGPTQEVSALSPTAAYSHGLDGHEHGHLQEGATAARVDPLLDRTGGVGHWRFYDFDTFHFLVTWRIIFTCCCPSFPCRGPCHTQRRSGVHG